MPKRNDNSLDKLITSRHLIPIMSNSKWVKLLTVLVENHRIVLECGVKLIWEDEGVKRLLVIDEHTSYNFDYYDTALEAMISGSPVLNGWCAYKEIEWLDFPRFIGNIESEKQDITSIQQKIAGIGQFRLELSDDRLRLYAYIPVSATS